MELLVTVLFELAGLCLEAMIELFLWCISGREPRAR